MTVAALATAWLAERRVWAEGLATNARTAGVTPPLALVLIAEGAPIADAVEAAELLEAA